MRHVSYTDFRQQLASHMDEVCDDHDPLLVTRQKGSSVVVMSEADYASIMETLHLLGNRTNAETLLRSVADAEAGRVEERDLLE